MSTKGIQVRPTGWESALAEEQFVLSDMDHVRIPDVQIAVRQTLTSPSIM